MHLETPYLPIEMLFYFHKDILFNLFNVLIEHNKTFLLSRPLKIQELEEEELFLFIHLISPLICLLSSFVWNILIILSFCFLQDFYHFGRT